MKFYCKSFIFFFTFFNMNSFNEHIYLQVRQLTDRNGERLVNFLRSCVYVNQNCILLPSNIFLNILMCRKFRSPKFFFEHPQLKKQHFELNCLLLLILVIKYTWGQTNLNWNDLHIHVDIGHLNHNKDILQLVSVHLKSSILLCAWENFRQILVCTICREKKTENCKFHPPLPSFYHLKFRVNTVKWVWSYWSSDENAYFFLKNDYQSCIY